MSYCQFTRKEVLQNAKARYSKEKATEYCLKNKEAIKKSKNRQKKKNTRLKSIKAKDTAIYSVQKRSITK